ncbi:unnamed protein product [Calicophoron daubneyi]|uniref:Dipeptidyl peptidase 9 n=1 Tax=Calicophoron daubneyi TaxID=300641 RepID=A0AAV2T9B9_CALDB
MLATDMYTFDDFYNTATRVKFNRKSFCIPGSLAIRVSPKQHQKVAQKENVSSPDCRVYFLTYPRQENCARCTPTLFSANVSATSPTDTELPWYSMLPEDFGAVRSSSNLAESLLRERMRTSASGVAAFETEDSGRIVLTACGRIFCGSDQIDVTATPEKLAPLEAPVVAPLQPVICPDNPNLVACVSDGHLTVGYVPNNTWVALTDFSSDDEISVGMPSYVVLEELDRYIGFWWRPSPNKEKGSSEPPSNYQILYEVVDERPVEMIHLLSGQRVEGHRYPRPGSPNALSDLRICEFEVTPNGEIVNVRHRSLPRPLFEYLPGFEYLSRAGWTPDGQYVWCQLITRLQDHLEFILIPTENFRVPDSESDSLPSPTTGQAVGSPCVRLLTEQGGDYWVKVHDNFALLTEPWHPVGSFQSGPNNRHLTFVWSSHRSGYSHLYLMQRSWPKPGSIGLVMGSANSAAVIDAAETFTAQLTNGSWEVTGKQLWVDEEHQWILFEANREHAILRHIYAVSYAAATRGTVVCLSTNELVNQSSRPPVVDTNPSSSAGVPMDTSASGQQQALSKNPHSCLDPLFPAPSTDVEYPWSFELNAFDPHSGWAVLTSSSLSRLSGVQVVRITFPQVAPAPPSGTSVATTTPAKYPVIKHVAWLRYHVSHKDALSLSLDPCAPPRVVRVSLEEIEEELANQPDSGDGSSPDSPPSQVKTSFSNKDTYLYGLLYVPNRPCPPAGYPTIHYVYGGPSVQLIRGGYPKSLISQALVYCHFGYAFFLCDCRGSANRGIEFAGYIKNRLGQVELNDHAAFLRCVARSTGLIDLENVAITGSSYGGYLTLMAAMRYSHIYRVAIAASPVVDWTLYDTAYTERYLGLPRQNTVAYWKGNVINYIERMPSDCVRLIIGHGGLDENVHFFHTSNLLHGLEHEGKPFTLLYYPTSRHGIKEYDHLQASALSLLERVLKPVRID